MWAVCGLVLLATVSCGSSRQRLEQKLSETVAQYMTENTGADVSVDSVRVLHIDSLSDYTYLLFVEKPIAENYLERLNEEYNAYPEEGSVLQMEQRQEVGHRISEVVGRLERLTDQLVGPSADSTNLKCFFVSARVYMKKGNQVLEPEYYGFPITPDFKVLESEVISE